MGLKRTSCGVTWDLTLTYEALELPGDPGQRIFVYVAEPNSPTHERLNLLTSWTTRSAHAPADADQS